MDAIIVDAKTKRTSDSGRLNDIAGYLSCSIDYEAYKLSMAADRQQNPDLKLRSYIELNLHRMERIEKVFAIIPEVYSLLPRLYKKVYWLVLTEHWCGDAAQILPVLAKIAGLSNGKIELRLLYRDQNPELMEANLTVGKRAIPRLLQLDDQLRCTSKWGPRPREAQILVEKLMSNPATIDSYAAQLHLWYARNNQVAIQTEILQLLIGKPANI